MWSLTREACNNNNLRLSAHNYEDDIMSALIREWKAPDRDVGNDEER